MQIVEELKKEGVVNTRLNDLGVSVIVSFVLLSPNVIICPFQLFLELILFWGISSAIILLRYCRNIRPMWVKFDSKDTKESEWCFEVLSTKSKKRT